MDPVLETFGKKLRKAREMRKMSQQELARRIGKKQKDISGYECGKKAIRIEYLPRLAEALMVSIAWLFYDAEVPQTELPANIVKLLGRTANIYNNLFMQLADFFLRDQRKMFKQYPHASEADIDNWSLAAKELREEWFTFVEAYYEGGLSENEKKMFQDDPPQYVFDMNQFLVIFLELRPEYRDCLVEQLEAWEQTVKQDLENFSHGVEAREKRNLEMADLLDFSEEENISDIRFPLEG